MTRAIILAGGKSRRFGFRKDKLLQPLWGKPVLFWSLSAFSNHPDIDEIVLVVSRASEKKYREIARHFSKVSQVVFGGADRFSSAKIGFFADARKAGDIVVFHNAANPGVSTAEISAVLRATKKFGAAGIGRKILSTVRNRTELRSRTIPRENLFLMETPQAIKAEIFEAALKRWKRRKEPTDDLETIEILGLLPKIFPATHLNTKITLPEDVIVLEKLKTPHLSIGAGEDSHRFTAEKKKCLLGGVEIPGTPGFLANSDGDVALHALCNALLSGLGRNSFSTFADELLREGVCDSSAYLAKVLQEMKESNAVVAHIALVFEGKKPQLEKYFSKIRKRLSDLLQIPGSAIGLNVHSGEELSAYGKGDGLRCAATVLLKIYDS